MYIAMDHPDSAIWLQSIAGKDICLQTCDKSTQVQWPNELDDMFKYDGQVNVGHRHRHPHHDHNHYDLIQKDC